MSKYVMVDLEMCRVPKCARRDVYCFKQEIIQIGAVLIDETLDVVDDFVTFVSPQFGAIDPHIEKLTGISQNDLQGAPKIKEAMKMFVNWLPDDAVLVAWSGSDEIQVRRELELKNIQIDGLERYIDNWLDCQKIFSERMNSLKNYSLSEALIITNINYDEHVHNALVDAKNTAKLFIKMECEDELILSPYYSYQTEESTYCPFEGLLANLCVVG